LTLLDAFGGELINPDAVLSGDGLKSDNVFGQYIQQRRLIALNVAKDNEEQNIRT